MLYIWRGELVVGICACGIIALRITFRRSQTYSSTATLLKAFEPSLRAAAMRGFSLVELMIALAIAAVMLSLAAPGMTQLIASIWISTQASDMVANLALSRSEAIKRGMHATLCPSDSSTACTPSAWSAGYIAFVDFDGDGSFDTGSDIILRVSGRLQGDNTLTSGDFSAATPLQFMPSGQAGKAGSFTLCQNGQSSRVIAVTLAGGVNTVSMSASCP